MASTSYPSPAHNAGAVTELEYERLVQGQSADGVLGAPGDVAGAYADGAGIRVVKILNNIRALVHGFLWDSGPTVISMPSLAANTSGQTRIDLIVLRLDRSTWTVREAVVQGVPGQGAPAYTQSLAATGPTSVWEIPLAEVTVANGASVLTSGTVTRRNWYLSEDGTILCTSDTRPPHFPGRRAREYNTDRTIESTGANWLSVFTGYRDKETVSFTNKSTHAIQVGFGGNVDQPPLVFTQIATAAGATLKWGTRAINVSTTGFTLSMFTVDGSVGSWTGVTVQWFAVQNV